MQYSRLQFTWPFQALSDETRFRVVRLLLGVGAPLTAGQLALALGITPNGLSRHLQILEGAGLTQTVRKGRSHHICLNVVQKHQDLIHAAVLAMDDATGALSADLIRFLNSDPDNCTVAYSADGASGSSSESDPAGF